MPKDTTIFGYRRVGDPRPLNCGSASNSSSGSARTSRRRVSSWLSSPCLEMTFLLLCLCPSLLLLSSPCDQGLITSSLFASAFRVQPLIRTKKTISSSSSSPAITPAPFTPSSCCRCAHRGRRYDKDSPKPLFMSTPPGGGGGYNGNSDEWDDTSSRSSDSNLWRSAEDAEGQYDGSTDDWQDIMSKKKDGSYWSSFESQDDDEDGGSSATKATNEDEAEAWLNTLASLSAEEVEFNMKEAERADKVRQMQEWGFDSATIGSALGVATDASLETIDGGVSAPAPTNGDAETPPSSTAAAELEEEREEQRVQSDLQKGFEQYQKESYLDDVDLSTVESHTMVEVDDETGDPVRNQMVYVDEHTCIGCTNCAMIAQSTFFMHDEHGRARVFQQWGDDEETIQIAIETCPVDCIHYVPYDELVKLEKERRDQNINFKARLVSQGEYGGLSLSHQVGGAVAFTAPQKISGNMAPRCNNCPSRGCRNCPMYGVGKNPEYEKREKARKERLAKRKLLQQRQEEQKSADL